MPFFSIEKPVLFMAALVVAACSVAIAAPLLVDLVAFLGQYIESVDDVITDYLIGMIWAIFLGVSILVWPIPYNHKRILIVLWVARVFVALGFMLVFEYHYRGGMDALMYVREARAMEAFHWGEAGTHRTVALVWLFHQILPDTYQAAKITFSMIGLLAIYLFYRAVVLFLQREEPRMLYLLGLFPSVLFWSSMLGKDPIVLFGIALYAYGVVGQYRRQHFWYLLCIVVGIVIATQIRPWMGLVLSLPLGMFVVSRTRIPGFQFAFALAFLALAFTSFTAFTEVFDIEKPQDVISQVSVFQENAATGGSASNADVALGDMGKTLLFLPIGTFTALFRPLPGEVLNLFGVLSSAENVVVLVLLWQAFKHSRFSDIWNPIILWGIAFVLVWGIFYSSVAFNLGMIVRYKLQIWPVMVCLLIYLARKRSEPRLSPDRVADVTTVSPARG